jgi:hypothetical protein
MLDPVAGDRERAVTVEESSECLDVAFRVHQRAPTLEGKVIDVAAGKVAEENP